MSDKLRKILKFALGVPLTLIAFYFIFSTIFSAREQVWNSLSNANVPLLGFGLLLMVLFFFVRSIVWHRVLELLGIKIDYSRGMFLLALAETKRYIPGNIFSFIARYNNYKEFEIPKGTFVKALFLESLAFAIAAVIVSIPGFFILQDFVLEYIKNSPLLNPFVIGAGVLLLGAGAFYLVKKKKLLKNFKLLTAAQVSHFAISVFFMTLAWTFFGYSNLLIANSLGYFNPAHYLSIASFFVLAWLLGYLSFVTPMGLGIREAIVTAGLSIFVPPFLASSIAIVGRIFMILGELLFLALTYLFDRFKLIKKVERFKIPPQLAVLWAAIISYMGYFIYVTLTKHNHFFTGRFDLGNMDQTVWNTLHGNIFMFTNPDGVTQLSRLSAHADFILILLAPFYLIWEHPGTLMIIQTIVIGFGAYFVYLIANTVLKSRNLALILGISYLLNPFVQRQNLYDFHAIALATTFLLGAFYFLIKNKYGWFGLFLLLAVLTKENVYLVASMFGVLLLIKRKWLMGTTLFIAGFACAYLLIAQAIPNARTSNHLALEYFSGYGETPEEIVTTFFTDPMKTALIVTSESQLQYLKTVFLHTGFLSFFAPFYLLFTGPDMAINLLSGNPNFRMLWYHYTAAIIPFVFISTIYAIKFLHGVDKRIFSYTFFGFYLVIFGLFSTGYYGSLPGTRIGYIDIYKDKAEHKGQVRRIIESIPQTKSISATNNLAAHLSYREQIFVFPQGRAIADYVFIMDPQFEKFIPEFEQSPYYKKVAEVGPFVGFQRIEPTREEN